ncbi:MAG: hypothetical protein CM1200mP39_15490 [Dehalococcoidia bacterium]|nr:MAG: hypothetical protein CM1200mP39_15490 [Dehalococcoidia bacterium]
MFQRPGDIEQQHDELYPGQFRAKGGVKQVPDKPGLGVDVDEDAIANSPLHKDDFITTMLHRRDGSVTNW